MPRLNGGQALVQSLAALGADMVFGVPGWGQYEAVDALWQHPTVRYVSVRNELDSTFLADAYAQVSNKPAVALVVPGPGLLYAGAGLASAFANSSPVLVVTSANTNPVLNHRQLELTTLRTMTKWTGLAHTVADIPGLVAEAWCQLSTGRPRPVGLVVPHEVLAASDEVALPVCPPELARPVANGVDTAAARIVEARRPLIWGGSGVRWSGAEDTLRAFAQRLSIPVTTTRRGKGLVDEAGPLGLGYPEMRYGPVKEWINQRDLVIAVGVGQDLSHLSVPVVQIDIDALQPQLPVGAGGGAVSDFFHPDYIGCCLSVLLRCQAGRAGSAGGGRIRGRRLSVRCPCHGHCGAGRHSLGGPGVQRQCLRKRPARPAGGV